MEKNGERASWTFVLISQLMNFMDKHRHDRIGICVFFFRTYMKINLIFVMESLLNKPKKRMKHKIKFQYNKSQKTIDWIINEICSSDKYANWINGSHKHCNCERMAIGKWSKLGNTNDSIRNFWFKWVIG